MSAVGTLTEGIDSDPVDIVIFVETESEDLPVEPTSGLLLVENEIISILTWEVDSQDGGFTVEIGDSDEGCLRGLRGSKAVSHDNGTSVYAVVAATPNATGCFVIYIDDDGDAVAKSLINSDIPQSGGFSLPAGTTWDEDDGLITELPIVIQKAYPAEVSTDWVDIEDTENADLVFTFNNPTPDNLGNDWSVVYDASTPDQELSYAEDTEAKNAIITLATDGDALNTSTANDILDLLNNYGVNVIADHAPGNDASGVAPITEDTATFPLSGGELDSYIVLTPFEATRLGDGTRAVKGVGDEDGSTDAINTRSVIARFRIDTAVSVAMSPDEVVTLGDTPQVLIPAADGDTVVPFSIIILYVSNGTPYVADGTFLQTGWLSDDETELAVVDTQTDTAFLAGTDDFLSRATPEADAVAANYSNFQGKAYGVFMTGGDAVDGNGSINIFVNYWLIQD